MRTLGMLVRLMPLVHGGPPGHATQRHLLHYMLSFQVRIYAERFSRSVNSIDGFLDGWHIFLQRAPVSQSCAILAAGMPTDLPPNPNFDWAPTMPAPEASNHSPAAAFWQAPTKARRGQRLETRPAWHGFPSGRSQLSAIFGSHLARSGAASATIWTRRAGDRRFYAAPTPTRLLNYSK